MQVRHATARKIDSDRDRRCRCRSHDGWVANAEHEPLVEPGIGPAGKDDAAVAPVLRRDPFNGVDAVGRIVHELRKYALGIATSTYVCNDIAKTEPGHPLSHIVHEIGGVRRELECHRQPCRP